MKATYHSEMSEPNLFVAIVLVYSRYQISVLTWQDLIQSFVKFEPIRYNAKEKEEDSQTIKQKGCHHTRSIPNFPGCVGNDAMCR